MNLQLLIPGVIIAWGIIWYIKSRSLVVTLNVVARISLALGLIYLLTQFIWGFLAPAGVCPLTISWRMRLISLAIPVIGLVGLFYLASFFPQLIETQQGVAILAGEDVFVQQPIALEALGRQQYRITGDGKDHTITLRGRLGRRAAEKIERMAQCKI